MRDIISKIFKGNDELADSKPKDDTGSFDYDNQTSGIAETAIDQEDKIPIEQTLEIAPVQPVQATSVDGTGATAANESHLADESLKMTKPLNTNSQDTLVGIAKGSDHRRHDSIPIIKAAHRCHVGNERSRNEDSTFLFTAETGGQFPLLPFGLYIVADGMGGHHDGHEASKNVSRLVATSVLERIYIPMLESSISTGGGRPEPIMEVLVDAVQAANQRIFNPDPNKDSGTTLTAGLLFGQRCFIAHVGDSRAYLLVDGKLTLLTTDHSYVQRLQDAGQLTEEEAAVHPQRNMLYKAVGQGGILDVDTFIRSLPEKGMLMLCSDGMWGLVDDSMIQDVLADQQPLLSKADRLVNLALQAGGHDNISVILVDFSF